LSPSRSRAIWRPGDESDRQRMRAFRAMQVVRSVGRGSRRGGEGGVRIDYARRVVRIPSGDHRDWACRWR
jgi:hypothetical protein